jgi:heterotetrameric sarcosine oxidase delta subunit
MLQIKCPWCGLRDETEYKYGGQAHVAYPEDPSALSDEEWAEYLFFRDNPKGPFAERWVHDTRTYEFLAVYTNDEPRPDISSLTRADTAGATA